MASPRNPFALDAELGEQQQAGEQDAAVAIGQAIEAGIRRHYGDGKGPARRDAHPKAHGAVRATFRVDDTVPPALAHGVFKPGATYKAWIRFSNSNAEPDRSDGAGDARGMAIKLTGVNGEKLLPSEKNGTTQDFILINHPVFFMDDPQRYQSVVERANSANLLVQLSALAWLGVRGNIIRYQASKGTIANPLSTRYWSMVPYRLGSDTNRQAVKYSVRPRGTPNNTMPPGAESDPNFLRAAMAATLAREDAVMEFLVQPRTKPTMSVEDSMTEWAESEAPFIKVATITIPRQPFDSDAQRTFAENLSFTPWRALAEHRPLGAVNRIRRVVYEKISKLRHEMNQVAMTEPSGDETF